MTCEHMLTLMQLSVDRELAETEMSVLEAHLATCPECAALYERLMRLSHDLEQLPKVVPPIGIVDALLPKLELLPIPGAVPAAPPAKRETGRVRSYLPSWKLAGGMAAAAVVLGIVLFQQTLPRHTANDMASSSAEKASSAKFLSTGASMAQPAASASEQSAAPMADQTADKFNVENSSNASATATGLAGGNAPTFNEPATPAPTVVAGDKLQTSVTFNSPVSASGTPESAQNTPKAKETPSPPADAAKEPQADANAITSKAAVPSDSAKMDKGFMPTPQPAPNPEAGDNTFRTALAPSFLPPPQEMATPDGAYIARIDAQRRIIIVTAAGGEEILRSAVWAGDESCELIGWDEERLSYRVMSQDGSSRVRVMDLHEHTDRAAPEQ